MRILIVIIAFIAASSAAAEDYCPAETIFSDSYSDKDGVGNYEFGYTSGYRRNAQGDYSFIYCIKNLSDQTPFEFKWKGPRPSSLLKGKVAYGQDYTEGWQPSSTPPDEIAERVLSLGNGGTFTDVEIETMFKKAQNGADAKLHRAQLVREPFKLGTWAEFLADIRSTPPEGGIFRRFSGVTFSVPSDINEWDAFIASTDQVPESRPVRVQAFFGVEYNIETLEMNLVRGVGFAEDTPPDGEIGSFLAAFSMDYPAVKEAGLTGEASAFSADQEIVSFGTAFPGRLAYIGIRQTTPLGSLQPYISDERSVRRVDVPVTLNLNSEPIFEFPTELLGLPASL